MVGPEADRILYDDQGDEAAVVRPGPVAVGLTVLVLVVGLAYLESGTTLGSKSTMNLPALETGKPVPVPVVGFDASSSEFEPCDGTRQASPDFSIVVAGATAADGQKVVSRLVQFVVIDGNHDYRSGRDVQAQSLCTLP